MSNGLITKLLKNTLNKRTKTITLTKEHLIKKIKIELFNFKTMSPRDISFKHFHSDVRVTLSENSLTRTKAKVIFLYNEKKYLIIYNK